MSQNYTLFVAISTGQNIVNLLPILELFTPEDRVLWVESATAKQRGWSSGALAVLGKYIVPANITRLEVEDDPVSLQTLLAEYIAANVNGVNIKLIGNGGTKPQMLAAFRALNNHLDEMVYNHDQQCVLEHYFYNREQPQPVQRALYQENRVGLADVLQCRGMEIVPNGGEQCIWPGKTLRLPRYGSNPVYTKKCHDDVWERKANFSGPPAKALPYETAMQLAPRQAEILHKSLTDGLQLPLNVKTKINLNSPVNLNNVSNIYGCAHKLNSEALKQQAHKVYPAPVFDIGKEFEDAVAARVSVWLKDAPSHLTKIIQSVWRNVKIRRQNTTPVIAEFDIVILLKNGVLLHLECKSFDADLKDMDARLAVLQRSTSNLARIAICVPDYKFATSLWYQQFVQNIEKIKEWSQFKLIGLTLPEQTENSFENSLQNWLEQFAIR